MSVRFIDKTVVIFPAFKVKIKVFIGDIRLDASNRLSLKIQTHENSQIFIQI